MQTSCVPNILVQKRLQPSDESLIWQKDTVQSDCGKKLAEVALVGQPQNSKAPKTVKTVALVTSNSLNFCAQARSQENDMPPMPGSKRTMGGHHMVQSMCSCTV